MKLKSLITLFLSIILLQTIFAAHAVNQQSIAPMLKKVMPAVVNISAAGKLNLLKDPFIKNQLKNLNDKAVKKLSNLVFQKIGSGVIINAKKGIIVTNAHVIDQAQTIVVNLSDGRRYAAKVLGTDDKADIAVLKIQAPHLTALKFANSTQLKVGDFVVAIGNPFGLKQTVTSGIVSGLHRSNLSLDSYENYIQTDAPINEGNSGGALVDNQGQLVGINTAILSNNNGGNIGIGFAIPSNMVKAIVAQIMKYGNVKHGFLGVIIQNISPQLATALNEKDVQGVLVGQVLPLSPAHKAGLRIGDIIVSANGNVITNNGQLQAFTGSLRSGSKLHLVVIRHHKTLHLTAVIESSHSTLVKQKLLSPFLYGMKLRSVSGQTKNLLYYHGVEVISVEPNSIPWSMGIQKGDIIVSANKQATPSIAALDKIANHAKDHILLQIIHDGKEAFLLMQ